MRQFILLSILFLFVGCTYQGESLSNYLDDPKSIIKDPHYTQYKKKRDAVESLYLRKEITYADYLKQIKEIDDNYLKEVKERTDIIESSY